jgi:LuxR family transcriptional regulator, maltose regulon positive regulatory protein
VSSVAVARGIRLGVSARRSGRLDPHASRVVWRTALVNRLRAARSYPVATLVAPTGYGKTTLLGQWTAHDERQAVWVAPDRCDGDLARAAAALAERAVVVVDEAHLLSPAALADIARLVRLARDGAMLVLSGRSEPVLPGISIPRLRACGELLELGPADLAFTRREARTVTRSLADTQLTRLMAETEGWPAAVQLAASARGYRGLQDACLNPLTPRQRAFLRRASVLERISHPLCDAVLGLESLDDLSAFLVPLDHRREWFRFHPLVRGRLRRELEDSEPELVAMLHARAASWYQASGDAESAIEHAHAAGDVARFLELFATTALNRGERAVGSWLRAVDETDGLDRHPGAAALAARLHAHRGDAAEASRCLDAVERDVDGLEPVAAARAALARAAIVPSRPGPMLAAAEAALDQLSAADPWRPYGLLVQGVACVLAGEDERADDLFDRAARAAERIEETETQTLALTERALLAGARDDHVQAEALLAKARARLGADARFPSRALTLAASARALLRRGRWGEARRSLAAAQDLLPATEALPWLAAQIRVELAAAHVMLRDAETARLLLGPTDGTFTRRRSLGSVDRRRASLAAEIAAMPARDPRRAVRLTGAELKLLPLLATHLSFREIGEHFYLSRHTVKTQAISAYRKLGASSRSEAVQRAEKLGLIDTDAGTHALT